MLSREQDYASFAGLNTFQSEQQPLQEVVFGEIQGTGFEGLGISYPAFFLGPPGVVGVKEVGRLYACAEGVCSIAESELVALGQQRTAAFLQRDAGYSVIVACIGVEAVFEHFGYIVAYVRGLFLVQADHVLFLARCHQCRCHQNQ